MTNRLLRIKVEYKRLCQTVRLAFDLAENSPPYHYEKARRQRDLSSTQADLQRFINSLSWEDATECLDFTF